MPAPVGGGGRPTARDQRRALCHRRAASAARHHHLHPRRDDGPEGGPIAARQWRTASEGARGDGAAVRRSEEHTSELQSLMRISYAVFCLTKNTSRENIGR